MRYRQSETEAFLSIYNELSSPYLNGIYAYEAAERVYQDLYGKRRFKAYTTFLASRARYLKRNKREKQVT